MRRDDICSYVNDADRARLEALIDSRNTPSKIAWRARIVLATADGHGTTGIAIARPGRHYKPAAGSRRVLKCQRHPDKTGRPTAATSPQHSNVSLLIAATHPTAASNTP